MRIFGYFMDIMTDTERCMGPVGHATLLATERDLLEWLYVVRGLDLVPPIGVGGLRYFYGIHTLIGLSRGLSIETVKNIHPMPL